MALCRWGVAADALTTARARDDKIKTFLRKPPRRSSDGRAVSVSADVLDGKGEYR